MEIQVWAVSLGGGPNKEAILNLSWWEHSEHMAEEVVGHGPAAKAGALSGNRGGLADAGLVLIVDVAQGPDELAHGVGLLGGAHAGALCGDGLGTPHHLALVVHLHPAPGPGCP